MSNLLSITCPFCKISCPVSELGTHLSRMHVVETWRCGVCEVKTQNRDTIVSHCIVHDHDASLCTRKAPSFQAILATLQLTLRQTKTRTEQVDVCIQTDIPDPEQTTTNMETESQISEEEMKAISEIDALTDYQERNGNVDQSAHPEFVMNLDSSIGLPGIDPWEEEEKKDFPDISLDVDSGAYSEPDSFRKTNPAKGVHICPVCNRRFSYQRDLLKHNKVHAPKQFACNDCPIKIRDYDSLIAHMRRHTGERPFTCSESRCKRRFMSIRSVRKHLNSVHVERTEFKCDQCPSKYVQQLGLYLHIEKHHANHNLNVLPYHQQIIVKCQVCNSHLKTSAREAAIQILRHCLSLKHVPQRPFQCTQCRFSASDLTNLNRNRVHAAGCKKAKVMVRIEEDKVLADVVDSFGSDVKPKWLQSIRKRIQLYKRLDNTIIRGD